MKRAMPRLRSVALLLFAVFLFVLLLINADIAMDGVRQGLSLCTETLIPSLFPFLVLSELLVASGVGETLGRLLSRPVSALFGLSGSGAVSLLLGSVCGFPVGTTTALALYQKGEMDKKELQRVVLFANNPSSGFLIGAVGEALFGNRSAGVALFVITLLSAATVGVVLHITQGTVASSNNIPPNGMQKRLSPADFTGTVCKSFGAFGHPAGFLGGGRSTPFPAPLLFGALITGSRLPSLYRVVPSSLSARFYHGRKRGCSNGYIRVALALSMAPIRYFSTDCDCSLSPQKAADATRVKKERAGNFACSLFSALVLLDDFFAVVRTAVFAHTVCENELAALCAFYHTGHIELGVLRTSLISTRLGYLFLRNCHFAYTSLGLC